MATEWSFPTSALVAIDWVNRNLFYDVSQTSPHPKPMRISPEWFDSVVAGPIASKPYAGYEILTREVKFLYGGYTMVTVSLEGWRYESSVTGNKRSTWTVESVTYRKCWVIGNGDDSTITVICNNEPATDGKLNESD